MSGRGPVGVGIIGAGNISEEYLSTLTAAPDLRVIAITDLDLDRARAAAVRYGIGCAASVPELLADPTVELVVNLTIPAAHAEVTLQAIGAGKHAWTEKPIALNRRAAADVLSAAARAGVLVGNAPDTILGEGIQTSQRLLDGGSIGTPQTVLTLMQGPGPDAWHPRPQFLFARGAGPLFDIGPYYVTTMVQLLGPIVAVEARGHRERTERVIGSGPDAGTTFSVEVDTHLSVLATFASGVIGTSIYSFDSPLRRQLFEITGSSGVLRVPVSGFDGATEILDGDDRETDWRSVPAAGTPRSRGAGVVDLARAIRSGTAPRASGALAGHVLDVLLAIEESAEHGGAVPIAADPIRVPALDTEWDPFEATMARAAAYADEEQS